MVKTRFPSYSSGGQQLDMVGPRSFWRLQGATGLLASPAPRAACVPFPLDPCDYTGPTQTSQGYLPITKSWTSSHLQNPSCNSHRFWGLGRGPIWGWGVGVILLPTIAMKCGDLLQLCKAQIWTQDTPKASPYLSPFSRAADQPPTPSVQCAYFVVMPEVC